MILGRHRLAINPLQFAATESGWFDFERMPALEAILEQCAAAGFTAVCASPPADRPVAGYLSTLAAVGMTAGPGYLAVEWNEPDGPASWTANLRYADQLAECGAEVAFIGLSVHPGTSRFASPGRGVAPDPLRTQAIAGYLDELCGELSQRGMVGALHPHVGSWVETEHETRSVLEAAGALHFGPDLGHLAWAGADIPALLADYRTSVAAVHVKDYHRQVVEVSLAEGLDYSQTVRAGLWTEPGRGDADLPGAIAALHDPRCWLVIEVDRAHDMDPVASVRRSADWLAKR